MGLQNAVEAFWRRADEAVSAHGELLTAYQNLVRLRDSEHLSAANELHRFESRPAAAYVPFLPAILDRAALEWLVAGSGQPPEDPNEAPIAAAEARLADLRAQDHRLGAGAGFAETSHFLATDIGRLLSGEASTPGRRTYAVAVGAFELAGYQAVDRGADGLAQQYYLRALMLAREAGDRRYGGYLLGVSIGHLALHCGYPRHGLRMVRTALHGVRDVATPLVLVSLYAVLARVYARLGEERRCGSALTAAESSLSRADPGAEPPWIRYLTPAYLADEVAHCHFDLGHQRSARREIRRAVAGVGAGRVRRRAIGTALLASSLARSGQVDEACARGREAADLTRRTGSIRAVQRVAQVRVDLSPYDRGREVRELLGYLREVLPASG